MCNFSAAQKKVPNPFQDIWQDWKLRRSLSVSGLSVVVEKLDESAVQNFDSSHPDEGEECSEGDRSRQLF